MIGEGVIRVHRDSGHIRRVQTTQRGNQLCALAIGSVVFRAQE